MIKTIESLRAPADPALLAITQAPVASIFPSPTNPRKTFDKTDLQDLVASVRQHGVLQPILVRPFPSSDWIKSDLPLYEIVAGERRWRAARSAGLQTIDVKVRDISDREVLEIQVIENLQRADLHPLEEADGYGRMMRDHGYSADQLAEKIGKSRAYIYARIKLLDLSEQGREAFLKGLLGFSSALHLARVPTHKLQSKALVEVLSLSRAPDEPASVRQVKHLMQQRYMLNLADASFPRDDRELLPKAGRCVDCVKRTGHQPEIFDDIGDTDVCTDPDCYAEKKSAHAARIAAEAQARGLRVISGKEAKAACPYGVPTYRAGDQQWIALDAVCHEDHEGRTYRELVAGNLAVTMIEDAFRKGGDLVDAIEVEAVDKYLAVNGIIANDRQAEKKKLDAENKKLAERLRIENTWRERVWDAVRCWWPECMPADGVEFFRLAAAVMWRGLGWMSRKEIAEKMGLLGKKAEHRVFEIEDSIPRMSRADLSTLLLDMTVVADATANQWDLDRHPPTTLLTLASMHAIDTDGIRQALIAETKAAKGGKKSDQSETKPAETETPATSAENDPAAPIAAQARGAYAAEKSTEAALAPKPVSPAVKAMFTRPTVPVKYRGQNGETWSGRGKKPIWIEAWIKAGKSVDDLEERAKSEERIEIDEKPTGG